MNRAAPQAKFYAILIGIDAYAVKPLKGCVNDVRDIEKYLGAMASHVRIQTLISADSTEEAVNGPTHGLTMWPTHANVKSSFQETMALANAGDFVYVHFAGHGTRSRTYTPGEFSNDGTGDLALVLLEHNNSSQEQYLRGDELASWLKDMVDKKLTVTLVLDCCFSASVYRYEDPDVRCIPYNPEVDSRLSTDFRSKVLGQTTVARYRDSSMLPNWLIDPDKYAILAASGPDQEAKELQTKDGKRHGILSYFLLQAWRQCGSIGTKHKVVHHHLSTISQKHGFRQRPILYGNKEQGFFGLQNSVIETLPLVITASGTGTLLMQAGCAHGICIGDEFVMSRIDAARSNNQETTARSTARAVLVRGLSSDLELLSTSEISDKALWRIEFHRSVSFQSFYVEIAPDLPLYDELTKTLQAKSFRTIKESNERDFRFRISLNDGGHYEVSNEFKHTVIDLSDMNQGQTGVEAICETIEHLAKYQLISRLASQISRDEFGQSCSLHLTHSRGKASPEHMTRVNSGEVCELVIANLATYDLYVFVYGMTSNWQITNLLRGTYEVVPPKNETRGLTGVFRKKLRMTISTMDIAKGRLLCEDEVKVIVTARPTSFDLFELPKLGQHQRTRTSRGSYEGGPHDGDDWLAFSFPIHICRNI